MIGQLGSDSIKKGIIYSEFLPEKDQSVDQRSAMFPM